MYIQRKEVVIIAPNGVVAVSEQDSTASGSLDAAVFQIAKNLVAIYNPEIESPEGINGAIKLIKDATEALEKNMTKISKNDM